MTDGTHPPDRPGPGDQSGQPPWGQPGWGQPAWGQPGQGAPGWGPPPVGLPPGAPGGPSFDVTQALGYAWRKFWARPSQLLLPALVVLGVGVVLGVAAFALFVSVALSSDPGVGADGTTGLDAGPGFGTTLLLYAVLVGGGMLLGQFLNASMARAALDAVDGRPVTVASAWSRWSKGQVALAAVLLAAGTLVGYALCFLPALVFVFFTQYTVYFVVDRGLGAVDAIRASVSFVRSHLTQSLLLYLLSSLVTGAGALVCGVGLLVALPITVLATACTFRVLHGQPVSPPA